VNAPTPHVTSRELTDIAAEYRHVLEEHRRAGARSSSRRHLERRLDLLDGRFERLLAHTPDDPETRAGWRAHLHHGAAAPSAAEVEAPLLFRGRSDAGAEVVVRRLGPRELDVVVDGAQVERLVSADELLSVIPGLAFEVGGRLYDEIFLASDDALGALRAALDGGRAAPADRELWLDGLVDRELALTPRGRRALAEREPRPEAAEAGGEAPIEIVTQGPVGRRARERLRRELAELLELAPGKALFARGTLTYGRNPSLARPAEARATIDLGVRAVHAHATAAGSAEAIDLLAGRMRRELRELRERREVERRGPGVAAPGRWRHGNLPPPPSSG
jgi:hypothetical protein